MSDIDLEGCWKQWPALRAELGLEAQAEDLIEHLVQHGETAFAWGWESGNPGAGAGQETVIAFGNRFFGGSDVGFTGPYLTMDLALEALELITDEGGAIRCDAVLTGIECPGISIDDLILRLDLDGEGTPKAITSNGTSYGWDQLVSRQAELLEARAESPPAPSPGGSSLKGRPRGRQLTDLYTTLSNELARPNPDLEIRNAPEALNGWVYLRGSDPERGVSLRYRMLEGCVELIVPRSQRDRGWMRDRLEAYPLP